MIFLGSERYDFSKLDDKFRHTGFALTDINGDRTTSGKKVADCVDRAKKKGNHIIIVSTYHSFHKLRELGHINICTFDEAHTTVNDRFTENIVAVKPIMGRQFFFTATRRVIGKDGGQNDEDFYGKVVYEMSPKKAMEKGEVVLPFIHEILIDGLVDEHGRIGKELAIKTVKEAFVIAEKKIKKDSYDYLGINGKMLVTVNGLQGLHEICDDLGFREWCWKNSIRIFAFSSDEGEFVDFKKCNRQKALEEMNNLRDNEKAILFHYDILTEGIDLPALTSVLLLRSLPTIKLLQNIGRAARLLKVDRNRIYSGEIAPDDYKYMVKPYCLVTIPHYTNKEHEGTKEIIQGLRESYDIPIENIGREDIAIASSDEILPRTTEDDKLPGAISTALRHFIEDVSMELKSNIVSAQNKLGFIEHYIRKM